MVLEATLKHVKDFHHWKRLRNGFYDVGIFANVLPNHLGDGYIGACRSGNATLTDRIDIVHYDSDLNLVHRESAVKGEDPRCFMFNGSPYALTWDPHIDASGGVVLTYKIIDLTNNVTATLSIEGAPPAPLSVLGKNWMPLEKDGELYLVVALDPQVYVLRCVSMPSGRCEWLPGLKPLGNVGVTISRGGTPLVYSEQFDCYVGLGHRSYSAYTHSAFLYTISKEFDSVTIGADIPTGKIDVQDPQSIFVENEKLYCCIGNWHRHAHGDVGLYEILLKEG